MEVIAVIVMAAILSAFAIGNGLVSRWDEHERDRNRGNPQPGA